MGLTEGKGRRAIFTGTGAEVSVRCLHCFSKIFDLLVVFVTLIVIYIDSLTVRFTVNP